MNSQIEADIINQEKIFFGFISCNDEKIAIA